MRFSIKIFIGTVLVITLAFSIAGYLLVSSSFNSGLNREIDRALEEHLSLRFMLESGVISEELQGNQLTDEVLRRVADDISTNMQNEQQDFRRIIVSDSQGRTVYNGAPAGTEASLRLGALTSGQVDYHIEKIDSRYIIYISGLFNVAEQPVYLTYIRNITDVFAERNGQLRAFMLYDAGIIAVSAIVVFLLSWLLTRPIRRLTAVSKRIAGGEYSERAIIRSNDEVGDLTESFNRMADSVQEKIGELELTSHRKDEFIANFTHELKTPMTSIIGYADMLRSREMDANNIFQASNYIFNEGKRLESLSLKMLELLMLENQTLDLRPLDCVELLDYISKIVEHSFEEDGIGIKVSAGEGMISADPDLIKSLLINIADNARKASVAGSMVELSGYRQEDQYVLNVIDHGRGIPENELNKITEAFYMVDKSRSRAQHGAGLGLAIASRIATLHGAELKIQSTVGTGTAVSIALRCCSVKEGILDE